MMDSMQEPKGFGYLCNIEKKTHTHTKKRITDWNMHHIYIVTKNGWLGE